MIDKIYGNGKYFQKSKSFLYPVLGIKKSSVTSPLDTYVAIKDRLGPEDMKLVVVFRDDGSDGFRAFEKQMLTGNPLFDQGPLEFEGLKYYLFDLTPYKADWFNFLLGRYSRLSPLLKRAIREYYGEKSPEWVYMETYLYPDKHFDRYAEILDVDESILRATGELCDPCDLDKETAEISVELLDSKGEII